MIRKVDFDSAGDLFQALSPGGKYEEFREKESHHRIYRGHSDVGYRLVPSALRLSTGGRVLHKLATVWPNNGAEEDSNVVQILREHTILRDFLRVADNAGLPLPEDSQQLRGEMEKAFYSIVSARRRLGEGVDQEIPTDWPHSSLLSLMGLAQHHGIPTRLLDWSRRADVAMYFAAAGKLRCPDQDTGTLAIWVFNLSHLELWFHHQVTKEEKSDAKRLVEIVTAPRAGNLNLHAQSGVFTLLNQRRFMAGSRIDRRPLDEVLTDYYDQFAHYQIICPCFFISQFQAVNATSCCGCWHEMALHHRICFRGLTALLWILNTRRRCVLAGKPRTTPAKFLLFNLELE